MSQQRWADGPDDLRPGSPQRGLMGGGLPALKRYGRRRQQLMPAHRAGGAQAAVSFLLRAYSLATANKCDTDPSAKFRLRILNG